jgi:Fe2+ or Zn2+ uptake regulation protein
VRTTIEEAGRQLEGRGHRLTEPRRAVLDAIVATGTPFTVEELCNAAPDVGRATVFRTVKLLQETDVICRLALDDGGVRYQLSHGGHHHHLICNSCGAVDEFSDSELDTLINQNASEHRFAVSSHSLELYGKCAECSATAARDGRASALLA